MNNNDKTLTPKRLTLNAQAGFSLIEALVAIAVLLLALVGPFTIATKGLIAANFARDQVIAFYLAQEATEIVRNKRDNNALEGEIWTEGLSECFGVECIVDATKNIDSANVIKTCSGPCDPLQQSTTSKLYGYSVGWDDTRFTRKIYIEEISQNEIRVTITILWSTGTLNKSFSVTETFFDWQ